MDMLLPSGLLIGLIVLLVPLLCCRLPLVGGCAGIEATLSRLEGKGKEAARIRPLSMTLASVANCAKRMYAQAVAFLAKLALKRSSR